MIFPKEKPERNQIPERPWWEAPRPKKHNYGKSTLAFIGISAGIIGGFLGANATGGSIFRQTNLVSSTSTIERAPNSVAGIAQRVLPSVVSISTRTRNGGGTGSGFVIDSKGYILTNNHVISDVAEFGGKIIVSLNNGTSYTGVIVGREASYDLAVLKIGVSNLPALQFGDSDKVQVGDAVIAIGSPLGLTGTVTLGIISAKDRAVTAGDSRSESSFINALQTDAAINPGNSGGPLVDATGAVIGVNSAIASLGSTAQSGSIGLGFAIPINQARITADQLIKFGKATYPVMGISVDVRYTGQGALIASVTSPQVPVSPAANAGLRAGDVITEIAGKSIASADELVVAIRSHAVGDKIKVSFQRGTVKKSITLTLIASSK